MLGSSSPINSNARAVGTKVPTCCAKLDIGGARARGRIDRSHADSKVGYEHSKSNGAGRLLERQSYTN